MSYTQFETVEEEEAVRLLSRVLRARAGAASAGQRATPPANTGRDSPALQDERRVRRTAVRVVRDLQRVFEAEDADDHEIREALGAVSTLASNLSELLFPSGLTAGPPRDRLIRDNSELDRYFTALDTPSQSQPVQEAAPSASHLPPLELSGHILDLIEEGREDQFMRHMKGGVPDAVELTAWRGGDTAHVHIMLKYEGKMIRPSRLLVPNLNPWLLIGVEKSNLVPVETGIEFRVDTQSNRVWFRFDQYAQNTLQLVEEESPPLPAAAGGNTALTKHYVELGTTVDATTYGNEWGLYGETGDLATGIINRAQALDFPALLVLGHLAEVCLWRGYFQDTPTPTHLDGDGEELNLIF